MLRSTDTRDRNNDLIIGLYSQNTSICSWTVPRHCLTRDLFLTLPLQLIRLIFQWNYVNWVQQALHRYLHKHERELILDLWEWVFCFGQQLWHILYRRYLRHATPSMRLFQFHLTPLDQVNLIQKVNQVAMLILCDSLHCVNRSHRLIRNLESHSRWFSAKETLPYNLYR